MTTPRYKKDILERLNHADSIPAVFSAMQKDLEALRQVCAEAADEITLLRAQLRLAQDKEYDDPKNNPTLDPVLPHKGQRY